MQLQDYGISIKITWWGQNSEPLIITDLYSKISQFAHLNDGNFYCYVICNSVDAFEIMFSNKSDGTYALYLEPDGSYRDNKLATREAKKINKEDTFLQVLKSFDDSIMGSQLSIFGIADDYRRQAESLAALARIISGQRLK